MELQGAGKRWPGTLFPWLLAFQFQTEIEGTSVCMYAKSRDAPSWHSRAMFAVCWWLFVSNWFALPWELLQRGKPLPWSCREQGCCRAPEPSNLHTHVSRFISQQWRPLRMSGFEAQTCRCIGVICVFKVVRFLWWNIKCSECEMDRIHYVII